MWKLFKVCNPLYTMLIVKKNEIGDIHLNTAFVCEETQPTPEDDVKTPPKSGTSAATSNDCASPQPGTSKREKEK